MHLFQKKQDGTVVAAPQKKKKKIVLVVILVIVIVIGVIAGAVVANLVSWGIASINGMAVAAVCYVAGQVVCKNHNEAAENA